MNDLISGLVNVAVSRLGKDDDETIMTLLRAAMALLEIERAAQASERR